MVQHTVLDRSPMYDNAYARFAIPGLSVYQWVSIDRDSQVTASLQALEQTLLAYRRLAHQIDSLVLASHQGGLAFSPEDHSPHLPESLIAQLDELVELSKSAFQPSAHARKLLGLSKNAPLAAESLASALDSAARLYLSAMDYKHSLQEDFDSRFDLGPSVVRLVPGNPNSTHDNAAAKRVLEEVIADNQAQLEGQYDRLRSELEQITAIQWALRAHLRTKAKREDKQLVAIYEISRRVSSKLDRAISAYFVLLSGRDEYFEQIPSPGSLGFDSLLSHGFEMYLRKGKPGAQTLIAEIERTVSPPATLVGLSCRDEL